MPQGDLTCSAREVVASILPTT